MKNRAPLFRLKPRVGRALVLACVVSCSYDEHSVSYDYCMANEGTYTGNVVPLDGGCPDDILSVLVETPISFSLAEEVPCQTVVLWSESRTSDCLVRVDATTDLLAECRSLSDVLYSVTCADGWSCVHRFLSEPVCETQ